MVIDSLVVDPCIWWMSVGVICILGAILPLDCIILRRSKRKGGGGSPSCPRVLLPSVARATVGNAQLWALCRVCSPSPSVCVCVCDVCARCVCLEYGSARGDLMLCGL